GDTFRVRLFAPDQGGEVSRGVYHATGPRYRFHIVGVVRPSTDVATDQVRSLDGTSGGEQIAMLLSRAYYERHRHEFLDFQESFDVQLADGLAGRPKFMAALEALNPPDADRPLAAPAQDTLRRSSLESPVTLETTVLLALGIGLAVAGLVAAAILVRAEQ